MMICLDTKQISNLLLLLASILLLSSNVHAVKLGISPPEMVFEGNINEKMCNEFEIYSDSKIILIGEDYWAREGTTRRLLNLHVLDGGSLAIDANYIRRLESPFDRNHEICITAHNPGIYHGVLLYSTQDDKLGVGSWLVVNTGEKSDNHENLYLYSKEKTTIFGNDGIMMIGSSFSGFLLGILLVFLIIYETK